MVEFIKLALPKLYEKSILDVEVQNVEFSSAVFGKRQADLLYKVVYKGGYAYIFLLLEHQSRVDQLMPLRMLVYMTRVWENVAKEFSKESRRKSFKLPQIIPVVFYDGRGRWSAPLNFIEKVDVEEGLEIYVPNFEYHVFDVKDIDPKLLEKERNALAVIIGMERESDVEKALNFSRRLYRVLPEDEKELLRKYAKALAIGIARRAGIEDFGKDVEEVLEGEEGMGMFELLVEDIKRRLKKAKEAEKKAKEFEKKAKEFEEKAKEFEEKAKKFEEKARKFEEKVKEFEEKAKEFEKKAKESEMELREAVKNLLVMKFGDSAKDYLDRIDDLDVEKLREIVRNIMKLELEDLDRIFG